jgi:hypothetical protein
LTNLGSESETCVGSRVRLVGVSIFFEKNFYRLPFTPPLWFAVSVLHRVVVLEAAQQAAGASDSQASAEERRPDPSATAGVEKPERAQVEDEATAEAGIMDIASILGALTVTVVRSSL